MAQSYKNNHYVPVWYQKRFLLPNRKDNQIYRLDAKPGFFTDPRGVKHPIDPIKLTGLKHCFAQDDLYTTTFQGIQSREIEKRFFGDIDRRGRSAVEYFSSFTHPSVDDAAYHGMMIYLSTQKLRTPKGLGWLEKELGAVNRNQSLRAMVELQKLFCAIWSECVWQIADASKSNTKFIISDHPVTVYNRVCGPRSQRCRGFGDPDIWLNGTHTLFPLSYNKILILTNLSWVRNPYQSETSLRPNPKPFRSAMFKFTDIQTMRYLSEQEVIDINYIIKRRSLRYIAAAKEEWLYPERHISTKQWNAYGHGYMLMPDPRPVHLGGEIVIGHNDGTASWYDEYGRRPWQTDYNEAERSKLESKTLYRFKGEYARLFGPERRGRSFQAMSLDDERDSDDFHNYHLGLERQGRRKRKKKKRRHRKK